MSTIQDKFAATRAATQSVIDLYELAQQSAELHKKAGQPLPPPIQALVNAIVGRDAGETEQPKRKAKLTRRPITCPFPILREGWVSIAVVNSLPQTLVPMLLAAAGRPVVPTDLTQQIRALGVEVSEGSVQNVGTRLNKDGVIEYRTTGWVLRNASRVVVHRDDRLHGAPEYFQSSEVASYRREVILALMGAYGPLTRAEIIAILKGTPWLNAPVLLSAIKMDLVKLSEDDLIRRSPGAEEERIWTWELTTPTPRGRDKQLRLA